MNQSVTVLMTTYNCAPYINQAIKSILIQTYKDFEFLIIDDGSIDETSVFVNQFNDKRIRYIKRNHFGRSASLNFGLENASNKIIALMDADDISHPKRIETQFMNLQNNLNEVVLTNGAYFKGKKILHYTKIPEDLQEFKKKLLLHGPYYHATMMFYKDLVINNGGYNTKLKANEDHELWLRLKDISNFKIINNILYYYRIRFDSLSNSAFIKEPQITYNIQEFYFKDLEKYFGITSKYEKYILNGWREYFYGNKNQTRFFWGKIKISNWEYRMILAYILSFLPSKILNHFKSLRIRLRLEYILNRNKKYKGLDKEFNNLLAEVSK
jgi:glycosyltransferase involved in cell wall biosynthesis